MKLKILLVEDNELLGESIKQGLEEMNWIVDWARDGREGLFLIEKSQYQVLLLDQMLPRLSGRELLRIIKDKGIQLPTIIISARSSLDDRVEALEAGADDYITKPFEMRELSARIKALFRRSIVQIDRPIEFDVLIIDDKQRSVVLAGKKLELTSKEYDLLAIFASKPTELISRQFMNGLLYSYEDEPESNSLDVLIARVRRKLQGSGLEIATIRGKGFVLRKENSAT